MGSRRRGDSDELRSALGLAALIAGIGVIIDLAARRARAEQDWIVRESKASPGSAWRRVGASFPQRASCRAQAGRRAPFVECVTGA